MTSPKFAETLERIGRYQNLTLEESFKLASALANESKENYENSLMLRHIAGKQPWRIEWLELWNAVHSNHNETIPNLAWAISTTTDLACMLRDRISSETFAQLVEPWREIVGEYLLR